MKRQLTLLLASFLLLSSCETLPNGFKQAFMSKAKKEEIARQAAEEVRKAEEAKKAAELAAKKKADAAKATAQKKKIASKKSLSTYHGIASWYSIKTNGNNTKTASGRPLSNSAYTCAHKTLPFGTKVRVTSLFNGKSEVLTVTDRGPYIKGRIIDVTIGSAKRLGFYSRGITKVKVEVLSRGNWKYRKP